jgi:hypothetical protein
VAFLKNPYQPKEKKLMVSDFMVGEKTTTISAFSLEVHGTQS